MYYIGKEQFTDRDVILASCELCIDNIEKLPADVQLDVLIGVGEVIDFAEWVEGHGNRKS